VDQYNVSGDTSTGKPTSLNNFKEVVYNNIDGGEHTITITYRKDGSQSSYDDRGYLLIPKDQ
jgi:hypothetical protein